MEETKNACIVCGNQEENKFFNVREMMFGTGDVFLYMECGHCRSIQITEIPADLGRYYPTNYYSFKQDEEDVNASVKSKLTRVINEKVKVKQQVESLKWINKLPTTKDDPVLDVGCGTGKLLLDMQAKGFLNLTGCDPYLNADIQYENGPMVYKKEVYEMSGTYKLIMMHHSFEHMAEPYRVLNKIATLLAPDGVLLIRIPVAQSFVFERYKEHWVQLDAPRHILIPSVAGMKILCNNSGLEVKDVDFDSKAFQFYGSEQYKMGIPLMSEQTYVNNPNQKLFKRYEIWRFKLMAYWLNRTGRGDSAIYYIRKK